MSAPNPADEALASLLIELGGSFWFNSNRAIMSEAAARLLTLSAALEEISDPNPMVSVTELASKRRRIAEEALGRLK